MIDATGTSVATATGTSAAPYMRETNRDASTLRMCAMEQPTVATGWTKWIAFVPTISFNAVLVNVVRRVV